MVAAAGTLWGAVVFFVTKLLETRLPLSSIIFYRMFFAFIFIFLFLLITDSSKLKIDRTIFKYVLTIGLISQCLFNISYFNAINLTSISTAVTLLYTAPIFIALMARIFFGEMFSKNKIMALLLSFAGCFLTITGGSLSSFHLNLKGVLFGILSGMTFGSLTIICKPIAEKYHPYTIVFYSMGFGTLFYLPFSNPMAIFVTNISYHIWLYVLSLSIISTAIAHLLYTGGLSMGIEASKAGIISTVELVVSVLLSYIFLGEHILGWKLVGILLVIGSVIIVQLDNQKFKNS